MTGSLIVHRAGPSLTIQDHGRVGTLAFGLSAGGALDKLALLEGAVLLGQGQDCAALEMAGMGGEFEATRDVRIALTGAPMPASLDGQALAWNASHGMLAGQRLLIGSASKGVCGYLHVGGGFAGAEFLGSRSAHLTAGIGGLIQKGDRLPMGNDPHPDDVGQKLDVADRFSGGVVRVLSGVHTALFAKDTLQRFAQSSFTRTARGNRQGVEMACDGDAFSLDGQLTILSEPILVGDIQMTGEGRPFVLLPECQTVGGYPRIATVFPDDLPIVAQAGVGAQVSFAFVDHATASVLHVPKDKQISALRRGLQPLVRDPREIKDLLRYQLISGVISGRDESWESGWKQEGYTDGNAN